MSSGLYENQAVMSTHPSLLCMPVNERSGGDYDGDGALIVDGHTVNGATCEREDDVMLEFGTRASPTIRVVRFHCGHLLSAGYMPQKIWWSSVRCIRLVLDSHL